ncbi:hypothetical protein ILUMI_22551 [Ignelater luminosus]|uniref:Carboxylic ester hydrolase n=1 Tax=Ignelater luminosus TaxID=2038154 RepID=A0A8K0G0F3_IGNLU|nr:hypothetical protein ILUMI_22551 [Ignelater luminosus]
MKNMLLHITIIINLLNYLSCSDISAPETRIPQGVLRGQFLTTSNNRKISAFTAIPYAEPPVGDLRFEPAQAPSPWKGILNASQPHPICPQMVDILGGVNGTPQGDEDCLYLNVYTPQLEFNNSKPSRLLPVMVFIHGGSLYYGSADRSQYNPTHLLNKDIVLVIPNYRLGPLGFLSTGDAVVPGNNGLKDQNFAINWTKQNIEHFGGDPDRITLFGQSSGGVSTHMHMLSPLSKDLIKGVISQSGVAVAASDLDPNNRTLRNTLKLAASFNCSTASSEEMVKCLRKADVYEITQRQHAFYGWRTDPVTPFRPVIEKGIEGAFLPAHPAEIIKSGQAAKVPFMTGVTTEDGAALSPGFFHDPTTIEDFNAKFDTVAKYVFLYSDTSPNPDYVTAQIKSYYFKNQTLTNNSFTKDALTDVCTDSCFLSGANEAVRLHTKYTTQPVYFYAFGYRGAISYSELFGDSSYDYGVAHQDELLYIFDPKNLFPNYEPTDTDKGMVEILTTLWTNFAATGNPTPTTDATIPLKWEPVKSENIEYYLIKNVTDLTMKERLYWDRISFWDSLPTK